MDPDVNPYSTPASGLHGNTSETDLRTSLRERVLWWERRRVTYNIVLLVAGLIGGIFLIREGHPILFAINAIAWGIGANIGYTLGPLLEIYIGLFTRINFETLRPIFFWIGIVGSAGLTLLGGLVTSAVW